MITEGETILDNFINFPKYNISKNEYDSYLETDGGFPSVYKIDGKQYINFEAISETSNQSKSFTIPDGINAIKILMTAKPGATGPQGARGDLGSKGPKCYSSPGEISQSCK